MKHWLGLGTCVVVSLWMAAMVGCSKEEAQPASGAGGFRPGDRAIQRAVGYLFTLIRLEERDRVFNMMDKDHEPILTSLKQLDEPRKRLIEALRNTSHIDLSEVLSQKRLTSLPAPIEVIVAAPKLLEHKSTGENQALVHVEYLQPDGKTRKAWTKLEKESVSWRTTLPFTDTPEGKAGGPSIEQTKTEVDKAVASVKTVMEDLSGRLEKGEMMEDQQIREKLVVATKPLAAAIQTMVYGQTNIK